MAYDTQNPERGLFARMYRWLIRIVRRMWVAMRRPKFGHPPVSIPPSRTPYDVTTRQQLALPGLREPISEVTVDVLVADVVHTPEVHSSRVAMGSEWLGRRWQVRFDGWTVVLVVGALLSLWMRFDRLTMLQAEMYGDIEIVQTYVRSVLAGMWPWGYVLSSGPLYHYLIAPWLWWFGDSYDQIKVTSVLTSLLIIVFTYLTARRLFGRQPAALSVWVVGSGSWLLIFSRLGNSQILVPLLVIVGIWALGEYIATQRPLWLVLSAVVATCGVYSYPPAFIIGPVLWLTVIMLWRNGVVPRQAIVWFLVVMIGVAMPFVRMMIEDPAAIVSDYISEKITTVIDPFGSVVTVLLRGVGAYFVMGDAVFRSNPAQLPHLDVLSSALLVLGLVAWVQPQRRAMAPLLWVPLLLLHIPSLLVLSFPEQVPSASRTLGVAPVVYLLVTFGLYELFLRLREHWPQYAGVVLVVVCAVILQQNYERYFVRYVSGMPYGDVPIGREIVRYAEMLAPDTTLYVAGCCWRDGIPEPYFSQIQMQQPERLQRFDPVESLTCAALDALPAPAVLIWSIDDALPSPNVTECAQRFVPVLHTTAQGMPLFWSSTVFGAGLAPPALRVAPVMQQTTIPYAPTVAADTVQINGVLAEVVTSPLDTGSIRDAFDSDPATLIKGNRVNPFVMDVILETALVSTGLRVDLAGMRNFVATLTVIDGSGAQSEYRQDFPVADPDQTVEFAFDRPLTVASWRLVITEQEVPVDVDVYIHVRTVTMLQ